MVKSPEFGDFGAKWLEAQWWAYSLYVFSFLSCSSLNSGGVAGNTHLVRHLFFQP